MSFIGLLVLLDEAISAADEKGLRKDWQKDMRGLLQAAVKQNKRAYTKRATAPAAPKKADATKSPAKQMKDAQRGNTGSGGSEVEGPKGGNRGAGFSGSLGGPGGGGYGGGSSGGGGGGGGYAADIVITGAKGKEKSNANPLRDAMQASDEIEAVTELLAKSGSKDAKALYRMMANKYSVRFAKIASEEYVQNRNIGNMQIVTIDLSVSNWKGSFEFTVTLNMADGGDLKVSSEVIVEREISTLDALGGAEDGDTVDFSLVDRLTDEPSNSLAAFFHGIVLNRDSVAFEMMLEEDAKTKRLARWAGQFAGMESPSIDPSKLPRGTYLLTDLKKQSNSATATVYLRTEATRSWYDVELVCRDSVGDEIEIGNITDGNGKKASLRDLNTALQADLDALDRSTPPD